MIVAFLVFLRIDDHVQGPDSLNYLAWLHSIVVDRDFFLGNDLSVSGLPVFLTRTGYALDIHSAGIAVLWMPFYALGHITASLLAAFKMGQAGGVGLGPPYVLWIRFGDWIYGLLAVLLTADVVVPFAATRAASVAVAVALGSPLLYYSGHLSPGTHAASAFLCALVVVGVLRLRACPRPAGWATLGVVSGLAFMVHPTNAAILAFPLAMLPEVTVPIRVVLRRAAAFGLAFGLTSLPQLWLWWRLTGRIGVSPYTEYTDWETPQWGAVLFSPYHGLYFTAPLLLLATIGLGVLWRRDRRLAFASLGALATAVQLNSVLICWWTGGAFGARLLVSLTPVFALGLAALYEGVPPRWPRLALVLGCVAGILWTFLLFLPFALRLAELREYYPALDQIRLIGRALRMLPGVIRGVVDTPSLLQLAVRPILVGVTVLLIWQRARVLRLATSVVTHPGLLLVPIGLCVAMVALDRRGENARARWPSSTAVSSSVDLVELAETYSGRARYYAKRGEWTRAAVDLLRAEALYPTSPDVQATRRALQPYLDHPERAK